ncbi:hypothetical protein D4S03_10515 [bacterium]|nr:MAG: hypothetical protein D4S03_10515 [bacterium]
MDKNWKTTLAGVIPGVMVFLYDFMRGLQAGQEFDVKTMVLGLSLAVLGYFAKSKEVTGGTVASTPEAAARVKKQNNEAQPPQ